MAGIITRAAVELVAIVNVIRMPNTETVRKFEKARIANPEIRVKALIRIACPAVLEALLAAFSIVIPDFISDFTRSMKWIE